MPEKKTLERARRARREGKAKTTQAGEFVREEMEHVARGKHGVKSRKQAIAIGLSKARRAGVKLPRKPAARKAAGTGRKAKAAPARKPAARKTARKSPARKPAARTAAARKSPARKAAPRRATTRRTSRAKR
jgi:uncharacterized protein DUF6496